MLDVHGAPTSLHAATAGRPAVIVFYRGGWCPYCNLAPRAYSQELHPALTGRDIELIAVSPQKPDGSLSTEQKNELPFPVLSDPGNALAGELGILLPARTKESAPRRKKIGTDLPTVNADGTENLPMPTVALIDAEHQLRWIDIHPDYTARTELNDILAAVTTRLGRNTPRLSERPAPPQTPALTMGGINHRSRQAQSRNVRDTRTRHPQLRYLLCAEGAPSWGLWFRALTRGGG